MANSGAAGPQPTAVSMTVAVLAGDGIGPEVMAEALNVLRRISELYGHSFTFAEANVGGQPGRRLRQQARRRRICLRPP